MVSFENYGLCSLVSRHSNADSDSDSDSESFSSDVKQHRCSGFTEEEKRWTEVVQNGRTKPAVAAGADGSTQVEVNGAFGPLGLF